MINDEPKAPASTELKPSPPSEWDFNRYISAVNAARSMYNNAQV